jgi:hypothetical protein
VAASLVDGDGLAVLEDEEPTSISDRAPHAAQRAATGAPHRRESERIAGTIAQLS